MTFKLLTIKKIRRNKSEQLTEFEIKFIYMEHIGYKRFICTDAFLEDIGIDINMVFSRMCINWAEKNPPPRGIK